MPEGNSMSKFTTATLIALAASAAPAFAHHETVVPPADTSLMTPLIVVGALGVIGLAALFVARRQKAPQKFKK